MSEELQVIEQKVEDVAKGVADFQTALDKNNGQTTEKIEALKTDVIKSIDTINSIQAGMKKQEEDIENILKQTNRIPGGELTEENEEVRMDFCNYLRRGVELSEKTKDVITIATAKAMYRDSDEDTIKLKAMELKSLMVGNDPNGGIFVRPEFSSKILTRSFESSAMRNIATIDTIGTDSIEYVIDDGEFSSGGWVSEIDSRPVTANNTVGKLEIHTHEQYAQPQATQKMIDDASFNIEDWISRKVSDKLVRTENTAFVTGNGAGKPKGILSYSDWDTPGTYARGKVEQIDTGISGGFDGDDFIIHQNALKEIYQSNATWLMKRATFGQIMTLKTGTGAYLLNPTIIATGANKVLLGNAVMFADDMPAIAGDALAIAYGDFREGYTIVDRLGIRILRDPFTSKPFIKFYTTKRVGGAVTNYESFKIMKLAS